MKANLFINYYVDNNPNRQAELNRCFLDNLKNHEIDSIYVIVSDSHEASFRTLLDENNPYLKSKVTLIKSQMFNQRRPTFNDYFYLSNFYCSDEDLSIIANTDIIIPIISISKLKSWHWNRNYCMALCRYDIDNLENMQYTFFNRPDAQDVWIVKGKFKHHPKADFTLGIAGCDNVIAYCLSDYFEVINPSLEVQTLHLHLTNVRNYIGEHNQIERLQPPYLVIHPTRLPL